MRDGRSMTEVGQQRIGGLVEGRQLRWIGNQDRCVRLRFIARRGIRIVIAGVVGGAVGQTITGFEKIMPGRTAVRKIYVNLSFAAIVVLIAGRVTEGVVICSRFGGLGQGPAHIVGAVESAAPSRS